MIRLIILFSETQSISKQSRSYQVIVETPFEKFSKLNLLKKSIVRISKIVSLQVFTRFIMMIREKKPSNFKQLFIFGCVIF
jgi:hypothetical protein